MFKNATRTIKGVAAAVMAATVTLTAAPVTANAAAYAAKDLNISAIGVSNTQGLASYVVSEETDEDGFISGVYGVADATGKVILSGLRQRIFFDELGYALDYGYKDSVSESHNERAEDDYFAYIYDKSGNIALDLSKKFKIFKPGRFVGGAGYADSGIQPFYANGIILTTTLNDGDTGRDWYILNVKGEVLGKLPKQIDGKEFYIEGGQGQRKWEWYGLSHSEGLIRIDGTLGNGETYAAYLDTSGKVAVDMSEYSSIGPFSDGLAWAFKYSEESGYWLFYVDKMGKEVFSRGGSEYAYNFRYGKAIAETTVTHGGLEGNVTADNVSIAHAYGIIDKMGKIIIPEEWDDIFNTAYDFYPVKKDGKWGVIDGAQKTLAAFEYDNCFGVGDSGVIAVGKGGKYGYVDAKGVVLVPFEYDDISVYTKGAGYGVKGGKLYAITLSDLPATSPQTAAPKVGDKLGDVLYTDIRAYINGAELPSYNIEGVTYVIAADLRNYGFNVAYDNAARTSSISFDKSKAAAPMTVAANTGKVGTPAFAYLYTDIGAIIGGAVVESRNVNGNIAIPFNALKAFGDYVYDNAARSCKLTTK